MSSSHIHLTFGIASRRPIESERERQSTALDGGCVNTTAVLLYAKTREVVRRRGHPPFSDLYGFCSKESLRWMSSLWMLVKLRARAKHPLPSGMRLGSWFARESVDVRASPSLRASRTRSRVSTRSDFQAKLLAPPRTSDRSTRCRASGSRLRKSSAAVY